MWLSCRSIDGTDISSLQEGAFDLCADTLVSVSLGGAAFPTPCPSGQLQRQAPSSDEHYCERDQAAGLAALYDATGGGSDWLDDTGWGGAADGGDWDPCIVDSPWFGVVCGDDEADADRVTELYLDENGLTGELPTGALASLSSLFELSLRDNSALSGTLDGLEALADLRYLQLELTGLTGTIDALAGMTKLEELDLSEMSLSGPVDALAGLTALRSVDVEFTPFEGGISALSGLVGLTYLSMDFCGFSGTIDALSRMTQMRELYISYNSFTGGIDAIAGMSQLTLLHLTGNAFNGTVDALMGHTQLVELWIGFGNQFSGVLRSEQFAELSLLQTAIISNCGIEAITGHAPMPESLSFL